jgi:cation:H+ antiporter
LALLFLGLAGLVFGGNWVIDGAVKIAEYFYISESLIGLIIVAVGTSLPELSTSAIAAYKKQTDILLVMLLALIFLIFLDTWFKLYYPPPSF